MKALRSRTFWLVVALSVGIVVVAAISFEVVREHTAANINATKTHAMLATATHIAQATQTQQALPTPTATPEVSRFAGATILANIMCSSTGSGCSQGNSSSFTTFGAFSLLWACSDNYVSTTQNATIQIQVFNSAGRQVDVLSEACTGETTSQGIISEDLPPGAYSLTVGQTTGPSWVVFALE